MTAGIVIRKAELIDLAELIEVCAAHAAFEQAKFNPVGLHQRLSEAFFGQAPCGFAFLAAFNQKLIGYASCSKEFSTWAGAEYLHMDCLFITEGFRAKGLGRKMLEVILDEARQQNLPEVQWQTPAWNENAIHFYSSLGATYSMKARFIHKPIP